LSYVSVKLFSVIVRYLQLTLFPLNDSCQLFAFFLSCQVQTIKEEDDFNPCFEKETCRDCITASAHCAWCMQDDFTGRRCDTIRNLASEKCHESQIYHPKPHFRIEVEKELSNRSTRESDAIQLKPQRVHLKLRPHSPYKFKVYFRQAVDYPVDLYYLMDLSKSMEDDKEKLALLGDLLAAEMQRITSNFSLGFGSFVDKVVMPYVSIVPERLEHPCPDCVAPYGFKNHMSLSRNTSMFKIKVKQTNISGNLDAPEGGFDAIMQSIVCSDVIRWRKSSRKLLVFSTDSGFHYAGDGKLGGIVKPNDGRCHMRHDMYTESSSLDYPSISQINQKVKDYDVNLIFAVTASQFDIYHSLTSLIRGSSAGLLKNDSSNVVELIKSEYAKITSNVELVDNASNDIKVTYYSSCVNKKPKQTSNCTDLRVGTTVEYDVEIEVLRCPDKMSNWNQSFVIKPVALSDQLIVDLEIICECDCEKEWMEERNSPKCSNGNGTYECGICNCNKNRYGKDCECDTTKSDAATDELACYRGNDTKPCSGRGSCRCGVCECNARNYPNERIYGKHCECDNFSCDRHEGKLCSGPSHGKCECRKCQCNPDWTGSACECKRSVDDCIEPKTGKICSGRGQCVCGKCKCAESDVGLYTGRFCELCPACRTQCDNFKECVQCQVWKTGPLDKEACDNCTFTAMETDKLEVDDGETHCFFIDEDDCKAQFKYRMTDEENGAFVFVTAQRTKDCPTPVDVFKIVIGVIIGIVLVGLALLFIWKILTTIHDRREFAKFEKERQMAKWDTGENPIYKQATTTFKNPTYGGKH
ncbi:integrin beta-PS-like protein, partial [Dinothrombium tinctorium]